MTQDIEESTLRQVANELRSKGGYWSTFPVEAMMGWLVHGGKCVYCNEDLVTPLRMIGGQATADHLLPKNRYPELDFANRKLKSVYLNAVPACGGCNCLKRSWDPNTEVSPQLYGSEQPLTFEGQRELIERSKSYVNGERARRQVTNEQDRKNWHDL